MEYLSCLIQDEVSKGSWTGVKTSRNGPTFTHLFFANDLIFFAKSTRKNCTIISRVLENFCCALGQKINFSKSKVFIPPYLDRTYFVFLEEELGLKISNSFSKYLEVPIIVDGRDKTAFDFVIDRVKDKLVGWKARTLSLAGHCTFIQAVTTAIPTHIMQCAMLPGKVCKELDKMNRNFLWGDSIEKKKLHLINWETVSRPKDEGGLGIKNPNVVTKRYSWNNLGISKRIQRKCGQTFSVLSSPMLVSPRVIHLLFGRSYVKQGMFVIKVWRGLFAMGKP